MSNQNQPIYILNQDNSRSYGKEAQRNNIMAAKLVAETVRTTLGPKGMDKMLVDSTGEVTITNDGVTILEQMQIEHPAAKMIVEVAKTQEEEVGDGTTTAVVFAGELLKNAESLLEKNIHPTVIAKGYRAAAEKSIEFLEEMAEDIDISDEEQLIKIAGTAMTGKGAEIAKDKLAGLVVRATKHVMEANNVEMEDIKLEKKIGGGISDSMLIEGIVLDKEKLHPSMPRKVENAKIALINTPLEIKDTEIDAKIQITDPSQIQLFLDQEEDMLKNMVEKIKASGANVVICQKGIDDLAQHYMAKHGIYAIRRVSQTDMAKLARATGAKVVNNLRDLSSSDLGKAGLVEEKRAGEDFMTYVTKCSSPKSVTLLLRGSTEHVLDESERAVKDALGDVISAINNKKVVAGAGAAEIELSKKLKEFAAGLSGREQLAVMAFADAVEVIPRTLAENAGLDPIDMLTELKSKHEMGIKWAGIDVFEGKVVDSWDLGVIEPLKIKTQAIRSASEVAELILRIDDVVAASSTGSRQPGMGPMGNPEMME